MPEHCKDYDISPAQLTWNKNSPTSKAFDDIYYSPHSELEESLYVFIQNNQLPERLQKFEGPTFTIAETGFGSGLNFLTTWKAFQKDRLMYNKTPSLHFVSVEKHPLKKQDLKRAHSTWPTLEHLSQQLLDQYPLITPGWHRLTFARCTLDLWFGDATIGFQQTDATYDALYLDGFAPSKNPDLWSEPLIQLLASKANPNATFSTYTAAGHVKRALSNENFAVKKVEGFGNKRDMLIGKKTSSSENTPTATKNKNRKASVIGAGVSGATIAWQLAERGWHVDLYETERQPAKHASGNAKGALYTKVTPHSTAQNDFYRLSYAYAVRFWRTHRQLTACGVLQLVSDESALEKSKTAMASNLWEHTGIQLVSSKKASQLSGQIIHQAGVWFPTGGWIRPQQACRELISHSNITFHPNATAIEISPLHGQWLITINGGEPISTSTVVLANGRGAELLWPNEYPIAELRSVRGQTTTLPLSNVYHPHCVVNHQGYCIPGDDRLELGATFQPRDQDLTIRQSDHVKNIDCAINIMPHLQQPITALSPEQLDGKVGIRCQSLDYLPLVGRVPDNHWRLDARTSWPNLYLCTAMGSRGFTSAPLAADMLASMINGDPLPVSPAIADALRPDRFLLRKKQ